MALNSLSNPDIADAQQFLEYAGELFSAQYDKANVTVDVQLFDLVDEIAAVSGTFDTDSALDVLYEDYFNMTAYVHTGRVVPMDDVISDEVREDIDSAAWDMSMTDGKTYMMPFLSRQNIIIYNMDLLKQCGLEEFVSYEEEIQNWTIDEWEYILDTLAENLPECVYPMFMYAKNNQGDTHIMSLMRAFGGSIFDEDGNFNFTEDATVRAIEWIQGGVERGWYPPHAENLEITDAQELFNNNQLAFYIFNSANSAMYDDLSEYGYVNFPGSVATSFVTGFEVFDNGDEAKVQAAKDFVEFIFENDELMELSSGNIPVSHRVSEKYADEIFMAEQFAANTANVVDFMNSSPNWQGDESSVRSVFWKDIHELLLGTVTAQECAEALDADCNAALQVGRESEKLHE
jgi:multiple sugar transport system substrate-binding protein